MQFNKYIHTYMHTYIHTYKYIIHTYLIEAPIDQTQSLWQGSCVACSKLSEDRLRHRIFTNLRIHFEENLCLHLHWMNPKRSCHIKAPNKSPMLSVTGMDQGETISIIMSIVYDSAASAQTPISNNELTWSHNVKKSLQHTELNINLTKTRPLFANS